MNEVSHAIGITGEDGIFSLECGEASFARIHGIHTGLNAFFRTASALRTKAIALALVQQQHKISVQNINHTLSFFKRHS